LLTVPKDTTVHIFSDSQAAINSIYKTLSPDISSRFPIHVKNSLLLLKIRSILFSSKNISLQLHKVRAHTGIHRNKMADKAAKSSLTSNFFFFKNNFDICSPHYRFFPSFLDFPIEH